MATGQRRLVFASRTAWRIAPHLVGKYAIATRVGPRSLTLQTPSRVCVTESNGVPALTGLPLLFHRQLVLHRLDAVDLLGDLFGLVLGIGGLHLGRERGTRCGAADLLAVLRPLVRRRKLFLDLLAVLRALALGGGRRLL